MPLVRAILISLILVSGLTVSGTVQADSYAAAISGHKMGTQEVPKALQLQFQGLGGTPEEMKAIFGQVLEQKGYRIDPIGDTVVVVRWSGLFRDGELPPRFQAQAKGGNQSKTELGFSIRLGSPPERDDEATYTIGASIANPDGEIWKGKIIYVSSATKKSRIMRAMIDRLVDAFGQELPEASDKGRLAD